MGIGTLSESWVQVFWWCVVGSAMLGIPLWLIRNGNSGGGSGGGGDWGGGWDGGIDF